MGILHINRGRPRVSLFSFHRATRYLSSSTDVAAWASTWTSTWTWTISFEISYRKRDMYQIALRSCRIDVQVQVQDGSLWSLATETI